MMGEQVVAQEALPLERDLVRLVARHCRNQDAVTR